jgi:hypothetical protein
MTVESSKWLSIIILLNCSLDFANQSKVICSFSLRIKLSSKRITHWVNVRRISWFVPLLQLSSSFMIDIDEDLWVFMTCIQRLSTIVRHTSSLNSQDVTFFKFKALAFFPHRVIVMARPLSSPMLIALLSLAGPPLFGTREPICPT